MEQLHKQVIAELAAFLGVPESQVEMWDRQLVEYLASYEGKFDQFLDGSHQTRCQVWHEGVRVIGRAH